MFGMKNKNSYKKITPQEAKAAMDSRKVIILDVRTSQEFRSGSIKGAINLTLNDIVYGAGEVAENKDAEILVYCLSGARSARAAKALSKLGYTNVCDFGGLNNWPY